MEIIGLPVPVFSSMIERHRLVRLFSKQSPPLTLACAAAGYGKTVFAAQLADSGSFDLVIWVQLSESDESSEGILRHTVEVLHPRQTVANDFITESVRPATQDGEGDLLAFTDVLEPHRGRRTLLVIDGVNALRSVEGLPRVAAALCEVTSRDSRVLVTCRRLTCRQSLDPSAVWFIEEDDLRFSADEVGALLECSGLDDIRREAAALHDRCGGHPAIARIMLRHEVWGVESRSRDLVWQTERMLSCLGESEIAALYLAGILRDGDFCALQRCAAACDISVDWTALARSVPLLNISGGRSTARVFHVHAVVSEVIDAAAKECVDADDRESIRATAFEHLASVHDCAGLANALELYAIEPEIRRWCESSGVAIIRQAGHASVARLLARLSPLSIASSATLLLLRAHVQRAESAFSAALESALMAKRVADIDADEPALIAAVLLAARLHFDRGAIDGSRQALGSIPEHVWIASNLAARCLRDAYLAVADAHSGDLAHALERCEHLKQMLPALDQGSDEAVFAVNCMGAVLSQCVGDWAATASILAPLVCRSDLSPIQCEHIRANYAAALLELGLASESRERAQAVISRCGVIGASSVCAYATATLSDACHAVQELALSEGLHASAERMFGDSDDVLGLAMHGINRSRALRASGSAESALTAASRSESLLAGLGPATHLMRVGATVEVAASHLALDDVSLAAELVSGVCADPAIKGAQSHRLRCALLQAEMQRRRGEYEKASSLLREFRGYILSGSANTTLAAYICAFPGILSLLAAGLGSITIPARILSLLPECTIQQVLSDGREILRPDEMAALAERFRALCDYRLDDSACADSREAVTVLAARMDRRMICRVRLFGRLDVETPWGRVEDRGWRKRKTRLLFLMLVCQQGRDIPRDVLLEYLWPNMDAERAQRNFYVTWSLLKSALSCGCDDADAGTLIVRAGGACRVTDAVKSDLGDFDAELRALRASSLADDSERVILAATSLSDIYRGELLPADVYEGWFDEERTRVKRDFCDAMLSAGRSAADSGKHEMAMVFLRRALAVDPWREDVYQVTMRCQMQIGQRSGAIETYNACRMRLADDLGIDPCAETTRLFQAVLAMEGQPAFGDGLAR